MRVRYYAVPSSHPLSAAVIGIFRLDAAPAFSSETILPKGVINVLFNFGPAIRTESSGVPHTSGIWRGTLVSGLHTGTVRSHPGHAMHTMGVNVRPEAGFSLLRMRLDELTNRTVDGNLVVPEADSLLNRLAEAKLFPLQCRLLLEWISQRLADADPRTIVNQACRVLRGSPGATDVAAMASGAGVSTRHLQRLFVERLGVTPARYVQLSRFAASLPLFGSARTLTEIAAAAGYFDHAHFCRDFRAFAGMTPDQYRQTRPFVPGHIFRV